MRELGDPSVLRVEEVPVPEVGQDQVLVKVAAAGVSYHDIVQRNGTMRRMTKLPLILGYEIAGTVEKVGSAVKHLRVSDRICTKAFRSCGMCRYCRTGMETSCLERYPIHGGYAEYVALPEEVCARVPGSLALDIACVLGPATGVALNAVRDVGKVRLGETVLITGAAGGVGLPAVELAKSAGADVIALTRSTTKAKALLEVGANHALVIKDGEDFSKQVREIKASGVDVVIDTVGSRVFTPAFKSLALGGRYVMVGQLAREEISINPAFIFFQRAQILGVGSVRRDQLEDAVRLAAAGRVLPKIATRLPLEGAAEAHTLVEKGEQFGRIVLQP
jgi:NADPH:quinone reductase-like Zn-dependent oxidoreductase